MQRRPWPAAVASLAVLLALAAPVLGLRLGFPDAGNGPDSLTSRRAYDLLTDGFGPGFNGHLLVTADLSGRRHAPPTSSRSGPGSQTTDGVVAVSPTALNPAGDTAVIAVTPATAPQADQTEALLHTVRDDVIPGVIDGTGATVYVGGLTAAFLDQTEVIAQRLPLFIAAVVGLSFLLLLVVFRSLLVAVKAALMNLLSVLAAYGVITVAADGGWFGQLIGIHAATPVPSFIPMMMFAILFGLSMDYEVFLLSRIREEYQRSGDNAVAVADGLAATARIITAAAAIMIAVFLAFVPGDQVFLKLIGVGMATAIFVDATLVRMVLVPASMELLGDRNWWLPRWLDRLLPHVHVDGRRHGPRRLRRHPAPATAPIVSSPDHPLRPPERLRHVLPRHPRCRDPFPCGCSAAEPAPLETTPAAVVSSRHGDRRRVPLRRPRTVRAASARVGSRARTRDLRHRHRRDPVRPRARRSHHVPTHSRPAVAHLSRRRLSGQRLRRGRWTLER